MARVARTALPPPPPAWNQVEFPGTAVETSLLEGSPPDFKCMNEHYGLSFEKGQEGEFSAWGTLRADKVGHRSNGVGLLPLTRTRGSAEEYLYVRKYTNERTRLPFSFRRPPARPPIRSCWVGHGNVHAEFSVFVLARLFGSCCFLRLSFVCFLPPLRPRCRFRPTAKSPARAGMCGRV